MADNYIVSSSPHIHTGVTTQTIMRDVIIALLPATAMGVYFFGWYSAVVIAAVFFLGICSGLAALFFI